MQERKEKTKIPIPLILVVVTIVGVIGYSLFNKYSDNSQEIANTNANSVNISSSNYNQANTVKNSNSSSENISINNDTAANTYPSANAVNASSNIANSFVGNTELSTAVDQEKARQMGQDLKRQYEDFLKDEADKMKYDSFKGITEKGKSFYEDVDNDGLEDAVFRYSRSRDSSDYILDCFVVYRNDGSKYIFAGNEVIGTADGIFVDSFKVSKGTVTVRRTNVENFDMTEPIEEQSSKKETLIYTIKDNRLQRKK